MFRSLPDNHQGVNAFLVKVTELKYEYSCVVMWQHNIQCIYVMFGVVRRAGFADSGEGQVAGTCDYGNEFWGSIKWGEFLD
jgi:hypothetical protein